MGVDPLDYDVEELRDVTGGDVPPTYDVKEYGFHWASPSEGDRFGVEDPTPEQARRVAELEDVDPDRLQEKPFLTDVPDDDDVRAIVLGWLTFLADEAGYDGALEALERYRELGWYTDAVEADLRGYVMGVGTPEGEGLVALDRTDHLVSFVYVARLASID